MIGVSTTMCNMIKDLGKTFDSKFKFRNHIDNINSKALRSPGYVYKLRVGLSS